MCIFNCPIIFFFFWLQKCPSPSLKKTKQNKKTVFPLKIIDCNQTHISIQFHKTRIKNLNLPGKIWVQRWIRWCRKTARQTYTCNYITKQNIAKTLRIYIRKPLGILKSSDSLMKQGCVETEVIFDLFSEIECSFNRKEIGSSSVLTEVWGLGWPAIARSPG